MTTSLASFPPLPGNFDPPSRVDSYYKQAVIAGKRFESVFLGVLLQPMFENSATSEPFGQGAGRHAWRGMLSEQYAIEIAKSGGIGLSDAIARELLELQQIDFQEKPKNDHFKISPARN